MKTKNLLFLLVIASFLTANILAFSIGKPDDTYISDGVEWYPIHYQDAKIEMTAAMPGSPKTGMTNDWCFFSSQYQGSKYEIHFNPHLNFQAPSTLEEFLSFFQEPHTQVTPIASVQPAIIYTVELKIYSEDDTTLEQISRVYATPDRVYFVIVVGSNFSLAEEFFNTFQITKVPH